MLTYYWRYMCMNRCFILHEAHSLVVVTMESQWRARHRITDSDLRSQWGYGVRSWIMLPSRQQTAVWHKELFKIQVVLSAPDFWLRMSWNKPSLQRFPGDSDVATIWEPTIYSKVIYATLTKGAECLLLLTQLISDLFPKAIMIYGDIDTILLTQPFNYFG